MWLLYPVHTSVSLSLSPSSSLVVFCIFNLLITHHSGRLDGELCYKAVPTYNNMCMPCPSTTQHLYIYVNSTGVLGIQQKEAWENHDNMNYICVCSNFLQTNTGHALLVWSVRGREGGFEDLSIEYDADAGARQRLHERRDDKTLLN